jgi:hypothetical protein
MLLTSPHQTIPAYLDLRNISNMVDIRRRRSQSIILDAKRTILFQKTVMGSF